MVIFGWYSHMVLNMQDFTNTYNPQGSIKDDKNVVFVFYIYYKKFEAMFQKDKITRRSIAF